jgi:hypothetical protein
LFGYLLISEKVCPELLSTQLWLQLQARQSVEGMLRNSFGRFTLKVDKEPNYL